MTALGIIAGGGNLPAAAAAAAMAAGRAVFIVALRGAADASIAGFPHEWSDLGAVGRTLELLRAHDCGDVLLAGRVARPRFSDLKLDARGLALLPKVIASARKGDDALLRLLADSFAAEGFRVVGIGEVAPGLIAGEGPLGRFAPTADHAADIALGIKVVRRLGALDIGQAAVVCDGLVLAVEAAEGTDAMIARIAALPATIRGTPAARRGVLVKALKPTQDGKSDLPVIGAVTIGNAADAGLAGIALETGSVLVIDRDAVRNAADGAGLFVAGFARSAHPD